MIPTTRGNANVRRILSCFGKEVKAGIQSHAIVSSLVTSPFEEYTEGSNYYPTFIRLQPILDELDAISDRIATKRNESASCKLVLLILLSTGGHPMLIAELIPWLLWVNMRL